MTRAAAPVLPENGVESIALPPALRITLRSLTYYQNRGYMVVRRFGC
jgi:hypothetical protein